MSKVIKTNFVQEPLYTVSKLRVHLFVAIFFVAFLLVYLLRTSFLYEDNIAQEEKINESLRLEYEMAERSAQSMPDYPVLQELGRKVKIVKELVNIKGDSTIRVLGVIENILPKNAVLTNFVHKPRLGEIDITVKAIDTLTLTSFVHELEGNESFGQVLIRRQSHDNQDADAIAYDIRIIQHNGA